MSAIVLLVATNVHQSFQDGGCCFGSGTSTILYTSFLRKYQLERKHERGVKRERLLMFSTLN